MTGFILIFIIGLSVGSFLNVLIDRLPRGEQVFAGRSHCDSCKHDLGFWDLIPLISFLALQGKCRYCHSPIPWQNPVVELVTAVVFVVVFISLSSFSNLADYSTIKAQPSFTWHEKLSICLLGRFAIFSDRKVSSKLECPWFNAKISPKFMAELIYWWFIAASLIVIFFADLKYRIIPDAVLFPAGAVVLFRLLFEWIIMGRFPTNYLLTGVVALAAFFALVIITKGRGMGLGDVKFAGFMGWLLGYPQILVALYLAFLTGAVWGVSLILVGRKKWGQVIAFGPFLVLGTAVSLAYGEQLLMWWYKLFV